MISDHEHLGRLVAFGTGNILVRWNRCDDLKQVTVDFSHVAQARPIGFDAPTDDLRAVKPSVTLGFNKVESIDVVLGILEDAKKELLGGAS